MNAIAVDFHFIQWVDFPSRNKAVVAADQTCCSRQAARNASDGSLASQATAVSQVAAEERFGHCGTVLCSHRHNGRRNRQEKQSE